MLLGLELEIWWFLVVGALFTGYGILDGFDFGAGAWHLFFKKEENRRIALNAIGPVWDGNEVWLVIGGGALFAGFPIFYATLFSSLYIPFMLFLTFLIFRGISIEFRSKEPGIKWRRNWDIAYSVSSIFLAFLLGVVLGNILQGIPINQKYEYLGNGLTDFLGVYPLLVGATTLALFMMHGALYLLLKTEGALYERLKVLLQKSIIAFIVLYVLTTLYSVIYIPHLTDRIKSDPLYFILPTLIILSVANIPRLAYKKRFLKGFTFSSITISLLLILVATELFPNLLISSLDPAFNLTIFNSAASHRSLRIMLIITAIGGPLVAAYTFFVYKTFWGKVKLEKTSY